MPTAPFARLGWCRWLHAQRKACVTKGIDSMGNKGSKAQVCLAGDRCVHYPHKAIPVGEEVWVLQSVYGVDSLAPYHEECTHGMWIFTCGDVQTSPYLPTHSDALAWFAQQADRGNLDMTLKWQLKRAHSNEIVAVLRAWAELQPLYVKAAALKAAEDYAQGDEIEADANEAARDLMTRLVDALQVG